MKIRHDLLQLLHKYVKYANVPAYLQRMLYSMFMQLKSLSAIHEWIARLFREQLKRELWLLTYART